MTEFLADVWEAVVPWLPWLVPVSLLALAVVFVCFMVWPERTARAFGLIAVVWDSIAKRFRRSKASEHVVIPKRKTGEPVPPTITDYAVPPPKRDRPETD